VRTASNIGQGLTKDNTLIKRARLYRSINLSYVIYKILRRESMIKINLEFVKYENLAQVVQYLASILLERR